MMLAGFLFLLLLSDGSTLNPNETRREQHKSSQNRQKRWVNSNCSSHADVVNRLNLTDKVKFSMTWPLIGSRGPLKIEMDLHLYAILDVKEKEQKFVSYIWKKMVWHNDFISWNPYDFCGIEHVYVPSELLWKPDIIIEEMTANKEAYQSPYLKLNYKGDVFQRNGVVLVTSCRMDFYKFPFDAQTCHLTFKSLSIEARDLTLVNLGGRRWWFIREMQDRSEWILVNTSFEGANDRNFGLHSSGLVFSLTIKRRPVLYIINFILPILFFLSLDLASFFISETGGEKISFKVTVLLAVTVMQLILNEILPSSSDRIPLIAVYCIGIFGMMMLSLLETILMMHLMEKDLASQDKEEDKDQNLNEDREHEQEKVCKHSRGILKLVHCSCPCQVCPSEEPGEELPMTKEGSSSQLTEVSTELEKLSEELREVKLLLTSRKEKGKPGHWTRMTKEINRIYLILYIITASLFLGILFSCWVNENYN